MYKYPISKGRRLTSLLLAMLLALALSASLLPQEVWADVDTAAYDNITYKILDADAKTAVVYGADASITTSDIKDKVEIGGSSYTVTAIGNQAFVGCSALETVTIPDSVASIGNSAFRNCTRLKTVTIPDSVTSISDLAFVGCSALEAIRVDPWNTSYKSVDGVLFSRNGSNLIQYPAGKADSTYAVPATVTSIRIAAFYGCSSLEAVTIPASVTAIEDEAFQNCSSLEAVTIPASVTSIGASAFQNCSSLKAVTIPDSVTAIGTEAFSGCSDLKAVTISDSVTVIEGSAFYGCSALEAVTIPDSVTAIGNNAFYRCSALEAVTIPDSVTSIGTSAFEGCYALKAATIPDSVTSIGTKAFSGCYALENVTIPDSVTSIGDQAFDGCSALKTVTISDSVTAIDDQTFRDCDALENVIIPDSVTFIGSFAFYECFALKTVIIPDSVTAIRTSAFARCFALRDVVIPGSISTIEDEAFKDIGASPRVFVTYDDPATADIDNNTQITGAFIGNPTYYRCKREFGTDAPTSLTLTPGDTYDLKKLLGITDAVYEGTSGDNPVTNVTIPFTLAGNTSPQTSIDGNGVLSVADDEAGPLTIDACGMTLRIAREPAYRPPALWYTLTAEGLSFPAQQYGDKPAPLPLTLICQGNTGTSVTGITIEGEGFLVDDTDADPYVSPGRENRTYRILPQAGLKPGTYKAKAIITYGWGRTAEAELSLTVTEAVQEAATGLKAKSKNYNTAALSWKAADRAEGYQIWRSTSKNKGYSLRYTVKKTSTNNTTLTSGRKYYYKIRAFRTVDGKRLYSKFTAPAAVTPRPSVPSFTVKAGNDRAIVRWKGVKGASGYRIYRSTAKKGDYKLVRVTGSKARTYTDTNLRDKKTYYYKIRSFRVVNKKNVYSFYSGWKKTRTK